MGGKTGFHVETPADRHGNTMIRKVVVEAQWYESGSDAIPHGNPNRPYMACIKPDEIAAISSGWHADEWHEVEGPARLLTEEEWWALVAPADPCLDTPAVTGWLNRHETRATSGDVHAVAWPVLGRMEWCYEIFAKGESGLARAENCAARHRGAEVFARTDRNWPDLWAVVH